jgi:VWFA-related protein
MSSQRPASPSIRSRSLVLAAALAALSSALPTPLPARQAAEADAPAREGFGETVSVEIVNVEVWVADRQGRPVTGLTREDFELLEDGEPVEITNFAAYDAPAPAAEPLAAEAPGEAPTAPGEGDESRLHLAILVDDWNLRPEDRARVLDDLREFLASELHADDRVMLAVHDSAIQLVQPFTTDPRALARAIDRIDRGAAAGVALRNERRAALEGIRQGFETAAHMATRAATEEPCVSGFPDMENAARAYAAAVEGHAKRSAGALASVSQMLSGVPGRKVLLYIGNGLDQRAGAELFDYLGEVCPHRQSDVAAYYAIYDLTWLYEEVVHRANAGGVTLYTLEAESPAALEDIATAGLQGPMSNSPRTAFVRGGAGGSGGDSEAPGTATIGSNFGQTFRPSATVRGLGDKNREDSLVYMARETGGRAVLNAADFRDDFDRIAADLRTHYSLGFSPDHRGDGRIHRLKVQLVGDDGHRVRHRLSYLDKPPEQRMAERVQGVAQFGDPGAAGVAVGGANPLGVRIETGEAAPLPGGGHQVPLRLWVPVEKLTLVPDDGALRGRLRVMLAVADARGNLGPVRQKLVEVELPRTGEGEAPSREKLVEIALDLEGERHVIALGVQDELGGEVSYLRHEVRIPAAAQARSEP